MNDDGTCPTCGELMVDEEHDHDEAEDETPPWHFQLMVIALIIYLGWRAVQIFV